MAATFTTTTNNTNIITTPCTFTATQSNTTMAWFYLNGTTPATYRDIVTIDQQVYHQTLNGVIDYGTFNNDHLSSALNANTWYHSCQVNVPTSTTSRRIYGYLNGELVVNVTDTDTWAAATLCCVGSSPATGYTLPFNGNIRDVRVWGRALSATEVQDEMRSSIPIHKPGLFLWLPLDDGNYLDKSGNQNVITVGSAVTTQFGPLNAFPRKNVRMW